MLEAAWAAKAMEAPVPPTMLMLLVVCARGAVPSRKTGDRADEGSEALPVLVGVRYLWLSCVSIRGVAGSCL